MNTNGRKSSPPRPTILIVEDDLMIGLHLKMQVGGLGYDVIGPVSTVEGAMAALDQEHIDAVLLDLKLYGEHSLPVARRLWTQDIPFIFVTGARLGAMAERFPTISVLPKPIDFTELEQELQHICAPDQQAA